ncbi:HNH endonuclease signature motif containing protein [Herbiconiux sp. L3-i23]|uniref:HNH endonuclease signature motif containing protein n=1 Tax=Herbiconiux sp. L3-i23 TaxID=2905871 RepID=UPI00205C80B6|nr:HNH endonuclease signature motif containing protein [Herbiconiux sp. L3-i23]BDI22930.1 HNH endonuclease [Herbiconiux sp. L3-i23]
MSTPPLPPLVAERWDDFEEFDDLDTTSDEESRQHLNRLADRLLDTKRAEAAAAADRYKVVDQFRREWESSSASKASLAGMRVRAMRAELAAALGLSERTIESLVGRARALNDDLPSTLIALQRGEVTDRQVQVIVDEAAGLTPEETAVFEAAILPEATPLSGPKFARKARTLREHLRATDLTQRHAAAAEFRDLSLAGQRDGMADLLLHAPAQHSVAIYNRVDQIARTLTDPDDTRILAQKRADVFIALLLDPGAVFPSTDTDAEKGPRQATLHRGVRPNVNVTVPALSLLGKSDEPANLEGYGPISVETARELAGAATGFHRILTHPETGVILSFGRDRYEVPTELKRFLRARDETCRFVGCNRPAIATDIDHTVAWEDGGGTNVWNLGCLCKGHHRLKHNTAWVVKQKPDGTGDYTWTSPLGRDYTTKPAIRIGAGVITQTAWLDNDPPPF